jgi:hypothetical protein
MLFLSHRNLRFARKTSMISNKTRNAVKAIVGFFGLVLFVRLLRITGWSNIVSAFRDHFWTLIVITVVYTLYHLLRTWTLRICTPHKTTFGNLFSVRLAGEAVAYIAVGSVLGDTLKVVLARDRIPVVESATGVFAEKLIYHLAGAAFIIGGLSLAVWKLGLSKWLVYFMLVCAAVFFGLLFLLSSGSQPLAHVMKRFPVKRPRLREAVLKVETALFQFRKEHPREFFLTFVLDLLSYFYSTGEVLFILYVFGLHPGFIDVWYFESIVKMSNAAATVVPANLGVFEAAHLLVARQLGLGGANGLLVALFVRIRAVIWSLIGYSIFLWILARQKTGSESKL